jgi:lipopolysaccharide transport system ATP-binding protein
MSQTDGNNAIEVSNLCKVFKIYSRPSDLVKEVIFRKTRHREFWALNNISFDVQRGEVVGLVGRNGAGKSTLLRILAGTLDKTQGDVSVRGNLSAILELGSGFNKEYTGRQNIRMGGLCLGMSRKEVEAKTDWIIEFSELKDFMDQPFRTYSSGMQARLTFATAAALEPDILIIDEALAVGDARFQLKCFSYLRELCSQGTTILLVSHDINAITSLCTRAIFLEKGSILEIGQPQSVTAHYLRFLYDLNSLSKTPAVLPVSDLGEDSTNVPPGNGDGAGEMRQCYKTSVSSDQTKSQAYPGNREKAEIRALEIVDEAGNVVSSKALNYSG